MKRLVLHIGPHKTGSTYLQLRLFSNVAALHSLGVAYPSSGIEPMYGHHKIAKLARHTDPSELNELLAPLSEIDDQILILSSENFDRLKQDAIAKLATALPATRTVSVVFFRRDLTDLLVSTWQESVKHGETLSFHEFVEPHISRPFSSHILNQCLILDRYRDQFGISSIKIVDYDAAIAGGDIFDSFCRASGSPGLANIGDFVVVNQSMALWEIELLRVLNAFAQYEGRLYGSNVRAAWLEYKKNNNTDNSLKELQKEISELIMFKTRSFNIRDSHPIQALERRFFDTYSAQIQPVPEKVSTDSAPAKEHMICLTSWLAPKKSNEIISTLFDALRPNLPKL
jgi:hypothetical protein